MSKKTIKHISGSMLRTYDEYKDQFIKTYILGEKFEGNQYTDFGKKYEELLKESDYKDYKNNVYFEFDVCGYKVLGYKDFENDKEIIECKTKSGWWSKNAIKKDWQFRIYNHIKGNKTFKIHQLNKKVDKIKIEDIGWNDEDFEFDLYKKIKEIEIFLNDYGFIIQNGTTGNTD